MDQEGMLAMKKYNELAQQAIKEYEELLVEASAGDRHEEHYAAAAQRQAQLAQLYLLAAVVEAVQIIAAVAATVAIRKFEREEETP